MHEGTRKESGAQALEVVRKTSRSLVLAGGDLMQTPCALFLMLCGKSSISTGLLFPTIKIAAEARQHRMRIGLILHSALIPIIERQDVAIANAIAIATIIITTRFKKKRVMQLLFLEKIR